MPGALRDVLAGALAGPVAALVADFGSSVTVRRPSGYTTRPDGSQAPTWATVASGVGMTFVGLASSTELSEAGEAQPVLEGSVLGPASVPLLADDGLVVTGGDYTGTNFRVTSAQAVMGILAKGAVRKVNEAFGL